LFLVGVLMDGTGNRIPLDFLTEDADE